LISTLERLRPNRMLGARSVALSSVSGISRISELALRGLLASSSESESSAISGLVLLRTTASSSQSESSGISGMTSL